MMQPIEDNNWHQGQQRISDGTCPLLKVSVLACQCCYYGHFLECHHPYTCEEAECSHYQEEMILQQEDCEDNCVNVL